VDHVQGITTHRLKMTSVCKDIISIQKENQDLSFKSDIYFTYWRGVTGNEVDGSNRGESIIIRGIQARGITSYVNALTSTEDESLQALASSRNVGLFLTQKYLGKLYLNNSFYAKEVERISSIEGIKVV
jgi:hypothetical protein